MAARCDTESLSRSDYRSTLRALLVAERKLTGPFTNPEIIDGDDLVEDLFPDVDHLNPLSENESFPFVSVANQPINFLSNFRIRARARI